MPKGHGKGSAYERAVAKELSLWWSSGLRDDLFWRSSQSGGRATQRAKSGKRTANACGDLAAQDASGQEFLDLFTIELKRGYNTYSVSDLVEGGKNGFNLFVEQARQAAELAGTPYWLLVHKRDRRPAVFVTNASHLCKFQIRFNWCFLSIGLWADFIKYDNLAEIKRLHNSHTL